MNVPLLPFIRLAILVLLASPILAQSPSRPRAREAGIVIGVLPAGPLNSITDVAGVMVGHTTLIRGDNIRTGVTAILPHGGNLFREKVPGAEVLPIRGFAEFMKADNEDNGKALESLGLAK